MTNLTPDPVRATLVASLAGEMGLADVASLPNVVDVLEGRADLLGDVDPEGLRRHFTGRLLYTLRSRGEGGACDAIGEARWARLRAAASRFDLIDLEGERDLVPEVLAVIPVSKRVISWHGPASGRPLELVARAQEYRRLGAALVKLVVFAESSRDALEPLAALSSLAVADRGNVLAFAAGACGTWTRLVAAHRGAPWLYLAAVDGGAEPAAPGQPELRRWIADFDLPWLRPVEGLFGVVGRPITHSLSPRLHNRAYASLGLPYLYLPLHADSLGDFWLDVVEDEVLPALVYYHGGGWVLLGLKDTDSDGDKDLLYVYTPDGHQFVQYMNGAAVLNSGAYPSGLTPDAVEPLTSNQGTDLVQASIGHTLANGVENLTLTGSGNTSGTGNSANNVIIGNSGDNILTGKAGADTLTGNGGIDSFVFAGGDTGSAIGSRDLIADFTPGTDRIDLTGIDANSTVSGSNAFRLLGTSAFDGAAAALRYSYDAGRGVTVLEGDTNGDRAADFAIDLSGNKTLGQGDFVPGSLLARDLFAPLVAAYNQPLSRAVPNGFCHSNLRVFRSTALISP